MMSEIVTTESRLNELNRQIAALKSTANRIKKQRIPYESIVARATRRLRTLRFMQWLRSPAKAYELWKIGLILVPSIPMVFFGLCLQLAASDSSIASIGSSALTLSGIVVAGILARLLFYPDDSQLAAHVVKAEIELRAADSELNNLKWIDGLDTTQIQLKELVDQRGKLLSQLREENASGKKKRAELLQRNWKAMRDYEWENYLVDVFHALGANNANRIGGAGDQGVDLIVEMSGKRIAVQAKGYFHAVNNKAVQEAYSGMVHHRCCACVVITNSRFTASARELAASTKCVLIGEDEFPEFVMGRIELCQEA